MHPTRDCEAPPILLPMPYTGIRPARLEVEVACETVVSTLSVCSSLTMHGLHCNQYCLSKVCRVLGSRWKPGGRQVGQGAGERFSQDYSSS